MATRKPSRTSTPQWRKVRNAVRAQAQANGQTRCPICRQLLDWDAAQTPRSAEVDHIMAHSLGGEDSVQNCRVICRECNQRLGGQLGRARSALRRRNLKSATLETSTDW